MTFHPWWSADLVEQLPLYGSVGAGLAFLLALCIRWWRREDDTIAAERARSIAALAEVKDEHRAAMNTLAKKTDRLERALGELLQASDDPDVRAAVTAALWPNGTRKGARHDG